MARPQAADYDERRSAILEKAAALYASQGFNGCSISDLASACGISKSLLYHYFSSKEDILFEIMQGHVADLAAVVAQADTIADPRARFSAQLDGFMGLYRDAVHHHKVLVNDLDKLPEGRRSEIVNTERTIIDAMTQSIAGISPGLAGDEARLKATTMLFFGMINWTHTWFKPGKALDSAELAKLTETLFLSGLSGT